MKRVAGCLMIFQQELFHVGGFLDHYHDDEYGVRASWDAPEMAGPLW